MAELSPRPCPPWCGTHVDGLHMSAHKQIVIGRNDLGFLAAYALALADDDAPETTISLSAVLWGNGAHVCLPASTPEAAEMYAMFIERLALATPKQHRELAAQVRAAAAVAFGETEAGNG